MRALMVLALLACAIPAQTAYFLVSPAAYASTEGPYNNTSPFNDKTFSYQQIHDDFAGRPRLLTEIAFRRDGWLPCNIPAWSVSLTLRLSTTAVMSAAASAVFAANHGPDLTEVLTRATVNFPATSPPAVPPAPFTFVLPFQQFFVFRGAGSLAGEVRVHSTSCTTWLNPMDAIAPYPNNRCSGTGCMATGRTCAPYNIAYIQPMSAATWKAYTHACELPAGQPCVWLAGVDDKSWAGLPLPFDLTPLGAPGCTLYVAALFTLAGTADANGRFQNSTYPLVFPKDPALGGFSLFSQVAGVDPAKPGLPIVFTDKSEVPIPFPATGICRVYTQGDDAALMGSVGLDFGLVTRVRAREKITSDNRS